METESQASPNLNLLLAFTSCSSEPGQCSNSSPLPISSDVAPASLGAAAKDSCGPPLFQEEYQEHVPVVHCADENLRMKFTLIP